MSKVEALFEVTIQLYKLLEEGSKPEKREQLIAQVDELLEQRDRLLPSIKPPFTDGEKDLGAKIVKLNKVIDGELKKISTSIQKELQSINKQRTSNKKYINPYESATGNDGRFFDKRK